MTDKNPYENYDDVDIPDFPSIKPDEETGDIDRSIFKMDDDENDDYYDDDDYDDEPKYRKVKEPVIITSAVIMVVLLALAIVGLVYGLNKKKAYDILKTEYDQYITKATATESTLNAKISDLQKQIDDLTNGGSTEPASGENIYQVVVESGIAVRKGASANNDFADYNALPDDIKKLCEANDGAVYINYGSRFNVLETTTENYSGGTRVWGRIADNAWVCLNTNGDDYCKKQ